jgi:hypothetical protein
LITCALLLNSRFVLHVALAFTRVLACHTLACHALYSNTKPFALAKHIIRFLARLAQLARFVLATSLLRGWEPPNPESLGV